MRHEKLVRGTIKHFVEVFEKNSRNEDAMSSYRGTINHFVEGENFLRMKMQ